jgi:lipid-binding SYLF domain-containing protein
MRRVTGWILMLVVALYATPGLAGWDPKIEGKAGAAIAEFRKADPGIQTFFDKAWGYAVFPTVGKAGIGIGGAYGKGVVYEKGTIIGTSSIAQLTIGFQWGGQAYREIIFFQNKAALDDFKTGKYELGAQVSAVAITLGASADVDYKNSVAVFTMAKGGLMYEASVGGQKFSFTAK